MGGESGWRGTGKQGEIFHPQSTFACCVLRKGWIVRWVGAYLIRQRFLRQEPPGAAAGGVVTWVVEAS
ncbi:hypothetical protein [Candidatus Methylacidithermus pantelleriae]|uniref:hypothetical protein n=1 Tax=Candidatus Methylacidithermus pantelleriae TaxID=2744239 RepID=UPI00157E11C6|nr:hypothetical protein [Candidatus Methylacidithermus pantelleriae]